MKNNKNKFIVFEKVWVQLTLGQHASFLSFKPIS